MRRGEQTVRETSRLRGKGVSRITKLPKKQIAKERGLKYTRSFREREKERRTPFEGYVCLDPGDGGKGEIGRDPGQGRETEKGRREEAGHGAR